MFLSPVFITLFFPKLKREDLSVLVLYGLILLSAVIHISTVRISTIAYSGLYVCIFLLYRRLLNSNAMKASAFIALVEKIIFSYAIVLFIQQISTVAGLPVFNKCWNFQNPFKLNSLALEPSYIGGTLTLLMYARNRLKFTYNNSNEKKKNIWLWGAYIYTSMTCLSAHTLIIMVVFLLYMIGLKRTMTFLVVFFALILLIFLATPMETLMQIESFNRMINIIPAILSFDPQKIIAVDLSASARIVPPILYLKWFSFFDLNYIFGHGVDYSKNTFIVYLLNTDKFMEQGNGTGGLFPAFFIDFGLLAGLSFFYCLKKFAINKIFSFPLVLWLVAFLPNGFNTAMQWSFFIIMTTVLYFEKMERSR